MDEQEVNARVEFKLKEILSGIDNRLKINWGMALKNNSQKHSHYYEAFSQIKEAFLKEINLPTPFDEMAEMNKRKKRNLAISKLMENLNLRGRIESHSIEKMLFEIIADAQYY